MADKSSVLDKLEKEINKKYGEGTLLRADKAKNLFVDRVPTGIFVLDTQLGGGIPRGRVTVIKGEYSTGKTGVALKTVSQFQQHCRFCGKRFEHVDLFGEVHEYDCQCGKRAPMQCVWMDAEHCFDVDWASRWGVKPDQLYVTQTEFAEQAIDVTDAFIRTKECDLLVVDSVAALTPSVEIEESSQKWQMGVFARLMGKALRKWTSGMNSYGLLSTTKCTILMINQNRLSIGGYVTTTTSPGGKALDFYESLELRLKKKEDVLVKGSSRPVGIEVEFLPKKNKVWPRTEGGIFKLFFVGQRGGYSVGETDTLEQVIRSAGYWRLINKGGAWYTFPDGSKHHGDAKAAEALRQNPDLLTDLMDRIKDRELSWAKESQSFGDDSDEEDVEEQS